MTRRSARLSRSKDTESPVQDKEKGKKDVKEEVTPDVNEDNEKEIIEKKLEEKDEVSMKSQEGKGTSNKKESKANSVKASKKRKSASKKASENENEQEEKESETKKKRAKKPDHQRITERDPIPKLWDPQKESNSNTFTVVSWNVAGLRAVLKNHATTLPKLVSDYNVDLLCLQETKLQEMHVEDPKLNLMNILEGYDAYYNCCTAKKGYSGTAVFVKNIGQERLKEPKENKAEESSDAAKNQTKLGQFFKAKKKKKQEKEKLEENSADETSKDEENVKVKTTPPPTSELFRIPKKIEYSMNISKHDNEGRFITLHYPHFSITTVYVPNSGQNLDRLQYRTKEWDEDFLSYMKSHENDLVLWTGDLNVAHTYQDVWNDGAKHLPKTAGTTPEEREAFVKQLNDGEFIDAFRYLHPTANGHYTYWSQRANNRPDNKGLRLDYFIGSKAFFEDSNAKEQTKCRVRDCFSLPDVMGSDHCPILLHIEVLK